MEPSHDRNFQSSSGRHRNYDAAQHPASHDVDSDFTMDDFTVDAHENDRTSHHTDSEHDAAGPADQGDARTDTRCLTIWPKGTHEITSRTMFGRAGTPHVEQISQMLERCKVQDGQEQAKEYRYAAGKFMKYMHALGDIEQKLSPGADGRPQRARVMKTLFLVGEAEFPELFGFESPEIVVQELLRDGLISQADLDGAQAAEETFSGHPVLDIHNERTRFFDALGIHSRPLAVMYDLQQSDRELFDHDFVTGSSQTQEIREVPAGTEVDTHVEQSENNDVHEHAQHFRGCAQLLLLDCDGLFDRHDVRNITNAINFKLLNTKTADEYKKLIKAELAMPFRFPGHPLFREAMQGSKLSRHVALLAYHAIVSAKCLVTFVLNISARLYQIRKQQSHQALKKARTNERKHFHSVNQDANGLLFSATETLAKILTEKADAADRRAAEETNLEGLVLILRDIAVDLTQDQLDTLRTYQEWRAAVAQLTICHYQALCDNKAKMGDLWKFHQMKAKHDLTYFRRMTTTKKLGQGGFASAPQMDSSTAAQGTGASWVDNANTLVLPEGIDNVFLESVLQANAALTTFELTPTQTAPMPEGLEAAGDSFELSIGQPRKKRKLAAVLPLR